MNAECTILMLSPDKARVLFFDGQEMRMLPVRGSSMKPFLSEGDMVPVRPMPGPPEPGRIYACLYGPEIIVHRYVKTENDLAVLWGDANRYQESINSDAFVGICGIPEIKWMRNAIHVINCGVYRLRREKLRTLRLKLIRHVIGREHAKTIRQT